MTEKKALKLLNKSGWTVRHGELIPPQPLQDIAAVNYLIDEWDYFYKGNDINRVKILIEMLNSYEELSKSHQVLVCGLIRVYCSAGSSVDQQTEACNLLMELLCGF